MSGYSVSIIADSIARQSRLTTFQCTFPRFILPECNTHKIISKNSASSRAIPVARKIQEVRTNPFIPEEFCANKPGMQEGSPLDTVIQDMARKDWLEGAEAACKLAEKLALHGAHKQWANRPLEPYTWHTSIFTATDWDNFFNLRMHPDAQPEFRKLATMMKEAMQASTPTKLAYGEWHLPYTYPEERLNVIPEVIMAACGRIARVSYETHNGVRDISADIDLAKKLQSSGHMSPFEHIAQYASNDKLLKYNLSNFRKPWLQFRKTLKNEDVFQGS